ncbi:hypothetical protein, partial [Enterococcus faecalis]|uniref:hypothetical protein n=1 Tax=Enterococcus faecalis TaxID=1351 RepID=UPI003D6B933C
VTGNNDTINGGSGLSLTISGANDTAYISNNSAPINFLQGSSNATVFGSYETILTGTGVSFAFNGAHDTIGFNGDAGGGNGLSWVIVG